MLAHFFVDFELQLAQWVVMSKRNRHDLFTKTLRRSRKENWFGRGRVELQVARQ